MPGLLARMDVGLCLYRKDRLDELWHVLFALKLFDYMASGLMVVASPIENKCASVLRAGTLVSWCRSKSPRWWRSFSEKSFMKRAR